MTWHPALCLSNAEVGVNFGATPFAFPAPAGYTAVAAAAAQLAAAGAAAAAEAPKKRAKTVRTRTPKAIILEPVKELAEQARPPPDPIPDRISRRI